MTTRSARLASVWRSPPLRLALAAGVIGLIVLALDRHALWSALRGFDARIGLLMAVLNGVLFALFAVRWRLVASALRVRARYRCFLEAIMLGACFSQFGPPMVIGEVTRFRLLSPYAGKSVVAVSQILDRLSGQIVLLAVIGLLLPYYASLPGGAMAHPVLVAGVAVTLVGGILPFILGRIKSLDRPDPGRLRSVLNPLASPAHYAASLAIQLLLMLNFALAARGIGVEGEALAIFLLAPLVLSGVSLLPITLADWGTREAAALLFFSASGVTPETIVALSLAYGATHMLSALTGALFLVLPVHPADSASDTLRRPFQRRTG